MAANISTVSYKNNKLEMHMYNFIKLKSSPSTYYKELMIKDQEFIDYITRLDKDSAIAYGFIGKQDVKTQFVTQQSQNQQPQSNVSKLSASICK